MSTKDTGHIYNRALVFGTFDQLHQGHKEYISRAFELANQVVVMVMSDEASRPTKVYTPLTFTERCQQITKYVETMGWNKSRFVIDTWQERPELYKRMLEEPLVDIVLTGYEYLDRTYEMFQARLELGLPQFTLLLHPRYRKQGQEITSTAIRLELGNTNVA